MYRLTALIILISFIGCKEHSETTHVDTKSEGEKLMDVSREWSRVAATDSIDKIASYWADDAVMYSPGHPVLTGKKEIRTMVEGAKKDPGFKISWEPVSASISECGDMGYLIERNQVTMSDSLGNPVTENGTIVTIWKKDKDGKWKNVLEMANEDPK